MIAMSSNAGSLQLNSLGSSVQLDTMIGCEESRCNSWAGAAFALMISYPADELSTGAITQSGEC